MAKANRKPAVTEVVTPATTTLELSDDEVYALNHLLTRGVAAGGLKKLGLTSVHEHHLSTEFPMRPRPEFRRLAHLRDLDDEEIW